MNVEKIIESILSTLNLISRRLRDLEILERTSADDASHVLKVQIFS